MAGLSAEPGLNSCIHLLLRFTCSFCPDMMTDSESPAAIFRIPNTIKKTEKYKN